MTENCIQNETAVSISVITIIYSGYEEHCHLSNFPFCILNSTLVEFTLPKQKINVNKATNDSTSY